MLGRLDHGGLQDPGQEGLQAPQVRAVQPGHLHQPEAARRRRGELQEGRHPRAVAEKRSWCAAIIKAIIVGLMTIPPVLVRF